MKKQRKKDDSFNSIHELAGQIQNLANKAHSLYSLQVDVVIEEKSRNVKQIEHLLDSLLDFAFNPEVLLIYKKLCRYYYFIDPQATAFYINAYREMWDENNPSSSQKK